VLAFGRGGALDTVIPERTGILFDEQEPEALVDGIKRMEAFLVDFDPGDAVKHAGNFTPERFDNKIMAITRLH
jgi:hypothetical protein